MTLELSARDADCNPLPWRRLMAPGLHYAPDAECLPVVRSDCPARTFAKDAAAGPELVVTCSETGGPEVTLPERTGFGTTIIERITGQALGGEVRVTYDPSGLQWVVRAPAGHW